MSQVTPVLQSDPVDLGELVGEVLRVAAAEGATQAEASASLDTGLSVTVRMGEVETLEHQRDRGLSVTVYFDHRKGSASTGDLSPSAIRATVSKACSIARYTASDDCSGLADAELMARDCPDLELCHPWDLSPQRAIEMATACERQALDEDPRVDNSEGATVSTHWGQRAYGNTHGFIGTFDSTSHSLSCVALARAEGDMQRDYWYSVARDWRALEGERSVGSRAAQRTVSRLGARKITTRKCPVIFPAELARGLIGHFVGAIRGSSQYRKSSFLLDACGEQVFPQFVNLSERPHIPGALGSAAFDDEGVATQDRELVTEGVLREYVLSSYSARKLGLRTTGNAGGIHNLLIVPGDLGQDGLIEEMGTGLLLRELMGQGVNPVTGDYSRGAAGFWVEDGEIKYPVQEVTVAGNLREMLRHIVAVGNDVDNRGVIRTGSILVDEMTVAGH